jgi:hypothetical protein
MHTDLTLDILDNITVQLGAEFQAFVRTTCPAFDTRELRHEAASRKRRQQKKAASSGSAAVAQPDDDECRTKQFNLQRYTYHSLGDYADMIRQFGTTDSYSTEPVSTSVIFNLFDAHHGGECRASLSIEQLRLATSARIKNVISGS